jgi:hypothetical protein
MRILKTIGVALCVLVLSGSASVATERYSGLRAQSPRPAPVVQVTENRGVKIARIMRDAWIGPMWQPDDSWDELIIGAHVTLTGNILVPATRKKHAFSAPIRRNGSARKTIWLAGTAPYSWIRWRLSASPT